MSYYYTCKNTLTHFWHYKNTNESYTLMSPLFSVIKFNKTNWSSGTRLEVSPVACNLYISDDILQTIEEQFTKCVEACIVYLPESLDANISLRYIIPCSSFLIKATYFRASVYISNVFDTSYYHQQTKSYYFI